MLITGESFKAFVKHNVKHSLIEASLLLSTSYKPNIFATVPNPDLKKSSRVLGAFSFLFSDIL